MPDRNIYVFLWLNIDLEIPEYSKKIKYWKNDKNAAILAHKGFPDQWILSEEIMRWNSQRRTPNRIAKQMSSLICLVQIRIYIHQEERSFNINHKSFDFESSECRIRCRIGYMNPMWIKMEWLSGQRDRTN